MVLLIAHVTALLGGLHGEDYSGSKQAEVPVHGPKAMRSFGHERHLLAIRRRTWSSERLGPLLDRALRSLANLRSHAGVTPIAYASLPTR